MHNSQGRFHVDDNIFQNKDIHLLQQNKGQKEKIIIRKTITNK